MDNNKYMKKNSFFKIFGLSAFFVLVGAGCTVATQNVDSNSSSGSKTSTSGIGTVKAEPAPAFSLKDYNGKIVSLSDFAGKPILINSWAVWCPFCKRELVEFAKAQKEFEGQVNIIAIDRAESLAVAKSFTDELDVTAGLIFLLDPDDSFYRSISGFSMPETILVNGDGQIVFHKRGPMDLIEIRQRINQLIN